MIEDKKVLFLDIDGVLNCLTTKERHNGFIGIDKKMILLFNNIIKETGAKVVLSSTWRFNNDWKQTMIENGLKCDFIGRTTVTMSYPKVRGDEVRHWLSKNPGFTKYAILDDDYDFYLDQYLFKTKFVSGLTQDICDKVVRHLNGDDRIMKLIIAGNYEQYSQYVKENKLNPMLCIYVKSIRDIKGYTKSELIKVGTYYDNPAWNSLSLLELKRLKDG